MKIIMKINPSLFRGYDLRGVYPQDLNENLASRLALALVGQYPRVKTVVVALDTRKSSPSISAAVNRALIGVGKKVVFLGVAPDPLFYFSIFHYGFDAGIMISASHNPKEYNGLTLHVQKTAAAKRGDIVLEDLKRILEVAQSSTLRIPKSRTLKGELCPLDPLDDYLKAIRAKIHLERPLKIVIDSGNGAMGFLPEKVFQALGCQVETLFGEFDGSFPHHLPDPYLRPNRLAAKRAVRRKKYDLGFVYDGDGDRVAAIDNRGRSVNGDFCFLMLARQALAEKRGPIVHDTRVSQAFLDEMKQKQVQTYFSVSHHTAVIKKIQQVKAVFGGEVTLHFLFPLDWYLCDEALFASLKLAEVASHEKDFARHVDTLPRYPASPEIFLACPDEKKFQLVADLQRYLRKNHYDFLDIDGARINFARGWALARAANTTPFIKCRFEGRTPQDLEKIEKESLEIFRKVGLPVTAQTLRTLGLR